MPLRLSTQDAGFAGAFEAFLGQQREARSDVDSTVRAIIADVRRRGDSAVLEYTQRFDRVSLSAPAMAVSAAEVEAAVTTVSAAARAALELAARRIEAYHRRQLPTDLDYHDHEGVRLGWRWTPIDSVGLYVPGGTAAYPSSVLMNAVPARVAGVRRLVMVVPAPDGAINPLVLAAARLAGVDEIYRIGGAQAVAALAYGTDTIAPVDKIVGPGNAYVASAKKMVFGDVGIDLIAGPSEVVVVADGANDPTWIAVDLLAQAEHDAAAQSILIADDAIFVDRVCQAVDGEIPTLARAKIARASWDAHGAAIVVESLDQAIALANRLAPEHLQLAVDRPEELAMQVRHAGAIFLGRYTPEAVGDYLAGPNHVLPTSRTARFASGLGVLDFLKRTSLIGCDAAALGKLAAAAVTLAEAEGLGAHARSIAIRTQRRNWSRD